MPQSSLYLKIYFRYLHIYTKLIYDLHNSIVSNRKNGITLKLLENGLNKLLHIHTVKSYVVFKKNEVYLYECTRTFL